MAEPRDANVTPRHPDHQPASLLAGQADIAAISISARIPDFWQDQPRIWFVQVEAVLQPQRLSDESRYHLVVAKLGKQVIQQVSDVLVRPPDQNKYETLKARLLAIYEESESRQVQKLIGEMDLGDQKPSQLLRRMRDLARDKVSNETLLILWQNHLPSSARAVLAVTDTKDLDTLSSIADKVLENIKPLQVASVSNNSNDTATIIAEIAKLNIRLNDIEKSRSRPRFRRYNNSRSRSRPTSRSSHRDGTPRRTPRSDDWVCFYHFRFKERAHKCLEPCAFKKTGN